LVIAGIFISRISRIEATFRNVEAEKYAGAELERDHLGGALIGAAISMLWPIVDITTATRLVAGSELNIGGEQLVGTVRERVTDRLAVEVRRLGHQKSNALMLSQFGGFAFFECVSDCVHRLE
jgi:hypothetical protein